MCLRLSGNNISLEPLHGFSLKLLKDNYWMHESAQFNMAATAYQSKQTQTKYNCIDFTDIVLIYVVVVAENHLQHTSAKRLSDIMYNNFLSWHTETYFKTLP